MTERRIITVSAYRTPDGAPACWIKGDMCQFVHVAMFGAKTVCLAHHQRVISRSASGYLQPPQDGCIVWPQGEA